VRGVGWTYANRRLTLGDTQWNFDGQKIFRRAVHGMGEAAAEVMKKCGVTSDQVGHVVPHHANLRIIEAVVKRAGIPMDKVMLTVRRYGNMSAATVPVALVEALVEALEEGRVVPGSLLLMPAFGVGLTLRAHLVRWGNRVKPVATTTVDLPPCTESALERVCAIRARKADAAQRSGAALMAPVLAETLGVVGGE
jgi:3-oxoacyl-[acyl-carrier-protein] synthase-3